jgi:hypothetical protein
MNKNQLVNALSLLEQSYSAKKDYESFNLLPEENLRFYLFKKDDLLSVVGVSYLYENNKMNVSVTFSINKDIEFDELELSEFYDCVGLQITTAA